MKPLPINRTLALTLLSLTILATVSFCILTIVRSTPQATPVIDILSQAAAESATAATIQAIYTSENSNGKQKGGWGVGDHYTLKTDDQGWTIVEPGRNHRKIYVSPRGKSSADGLTPETAMTPAAGVALWKSLLQKSVKEGNPASHWILYERGHSYSDIYLPNQTLGESPLHPLLLGAYGSGANPVITKGAGMNQKGAGNIVVRDLDFKEKVSIQGPSRNFLFENNTHYGTLLVQLGPDQFTVRRSKILDVHREEPAGATTTDAIFDGSGHSNRESGMYSNKDVDGLLIEEVFVDHNGWEEGYLTDPTKHPPSIYSHNLYLSSQITDLTYRNNVSARGASVGAQFRSGAYVVDSVFIDNNIGFFVGDGGEDPAEPTSNIGNYSFVADNLITSAGYHKYFGNNGGYGWGFNVNGEAAAAVKNNIFTHSMNPNDPTEIARKMAVRPGGARAFGIKGTTFENSNNYIYKWGNQGEFSEDNVSKTQFGKDLDQITIQNYAASTLSRNGATIDDILQHMRKRTKENWNSIQWSSGVLTYFRNAYNLPTNIRTGPTSVTFSPYKYNGGVRWDDKYNWSTTDVPGRIKGDTVKLNGHTVNFSGTVYLSALDLGNSGDLFVGQGYLEVQGDLQTGSNSTITIHNAGQLWLNGYSDSDPLSVSISSGRFANTRSVTGPLTLKITGGEVLFGTGNSVYTVKSNSSLEISGNTAFVGFDGTGGTARLNFENGAKLNFNLIGNRTTAISEFQSGNFGSQPSRVDSEVSLAGAAIQVAVGETVGTSIVANLIVVDRLVGTPASFVATGLGNTRDAILTINATLGTVSLSIVPGSGKSTITTSNSSTPLVTTPEITLRLDQTSILAKGSTNLTWTAKNATNCLASGAWTGTKTLSGTQRVTAGTAAGDIRTFTISCGGIGATTSQSVSLLAVSSPAAVSTTTTPATTTAITPKPVATTTTPKPVATTTTTSPSTPPQSSTNQTSDTPRTVEPPVSRPIQIPATFSFKRNISATQAPKDDVEYLQHFLNQYNKEKLPVDGSYDEADKEAVKRFQKKYAREILEVWNLTEATGFVGITTRLKMNYLLKGSSASCPVFIEFNGGKSGIRSSSEIGKTQNILKELDMYSGPINNTWDTPTNNALIKFQETFREVMLDPWKIDKGTGYKYKTTNKFLNYFAGCDTGAVFLEGVGNYEGI
jgi:Putative peptidoglycan binding domain